MKDRIDMHAHFYGGGLQDMLHGRTARPYLRHRPDGSQGMVAMNGEFPFKPDYFDIVVGLTQMDQQGLTHRLLTFPGALGLDVLPAEEVALAITAFNTHLAELHGATGGRIFGLAGLPLTDPELAAQEVRRIRRELRLPGIILPSNYFNSVAEAKSLAPVLSAANETGCHIMLHPGLKAGEAPPAPPDDFVQYRTSAVALQAQVSQNVLTLILSDIQDLWPRLSFQLVNLGGTLPFIHERMEAIARHRNPDAPFPTARLRNLWYDCASLGPRAVEAAAGLYGADRIFLGSDYPIFSDNPYERALSPARLDDADKERIAGGNARALLEAMTDG
ncbi:amidohydrolase [Defluviimonas sp. WL0050]|uniref:Amidohydrolase n=1 Tax=Albidovulum litorale TaxID=2984134 RepID=A0ABT2ZPJ5_9RHOB|nr:amidohydrolase [Defluviimonas sp. WL0050]MCV2873073.1 amidohydrolase [Defluviimonas sp. WL0050]